MARRNELCSTAGTGYASVTRKNRRDHRPDGAAHDPRLRRHVDFGEER